MRHCTWILRALAVRPLAIAVLIVTGAVLAAAAPCVAPGTRPGGGPSTDPANPNPNYIASGQPGFGVSGPTDLDDGGTGDGDKANDACMTLVFNVPPPSEEKGYSGWGGLTLTFSQPIDGGSFVFDPACATPTDGTLGQVLDVGGEPLVSPNQSITFTPGNYKVNPTGTTVTKSGNPINVGSQAATYSQFAVTIMYDTTQPTPYLMFGTEENPLSYWVGKPGKQNGGFTPYQGSTGPGTPGVDFAQLPEPSFLLPLGLFGGIASLFGLRARRRKATA